METTSYLIQTVVSIITALIVSTITISMNSKKYYEQQWWNRRAEKYEEVLKTLGQLKQIYDELVFDTSDGTSMNLKKYPNFFDLKTKLKIEGATAQFYLDDKTAKLLSELESCFFEEEMEFGMVMDNDLIYPTQKALSENINEIIKNAKNNLGRK